jgi:hypothetical protein
MTIYPTGGGEPLFFEPQSLCSKNIEQTDPISILRNHSVQTPVNSVRYASKTENTQDGFAEKGMRPRAAACPDSASPPKHFIDFHEAISS